jgi:hypothetical protein
MKVIAMCGARKFPVIYFGKHVTGKPVFFIRDAEGERLMARRVNEVIDLIRPDAVYIGQDELVNAYPVHRRKPLLERPIIGREFVPPAGKYAGVPPHVLWSEFLRFYRDLLAPRGVELCLWGDCLLSSEEFDGSPAGKADGIYGGLPDNLYLARETSPKDVLLLDWHYNSTWCYPSVDRLTGAGFRLLAAPWEQAGNTFFFCKYLKAHGGPGARGIFNTWWSDPPPLEERLPHIADCAWTVGRLAVMPPDLAKLISVAEEAEAKPLQHLGPGPFQKDLRLSLPDGGHFFSDGWIEFRPMPEGLGVKADRRGYLDFCFAAEKGTFERLSIRVWFRNLGHNAVLVQAGERKTDHWSVLGEDRDWQGEPLDLREHARGQCRVFVRFRAHSRADLKAVTACLTRLAVEGEVAK